MLKKLRDIWDVKSEIALAWRIIADEGGLEDIDEINSIGDALEQITVADLLEMYPRGFAVGPMAGLYTIVRPANYNDVTNTGTLIVQRSFNTVGD